jgi:choline dehydrogenase
MQDISRRDFFRGSLASAIGLGLLGLPWKSRAATTEFDYIVVGAGASGCVVANRLSADGNANVLLLEAGPMTDLFPAIPQVDLPSLFSLWGPHLAWIFATQAEHALDGRSVSLLAGKVVGGGSSINGRIFIRGDRLDFDHWNYLGNEGWSYEGVLPYFRKFETYMGAHPSPQRGTNGPMPIIHLPIYTEAARRFVDAGAALGFNRDWDFNGTQDLDGGVGLTESNTYPDTVTRASTETAYIRPLLGQPNFALQIEVQITRVLFEGTRAVGVEYLQDGTLHQARATSEVIISAGAYNTPKLLMLSGIGPASHLRRHRIPVVANLPGVGHNLQDHALVQLDFSSRMPPAVPPIILSEANLFTHVFADLDAASPDLQFMFGHFLFPNVAEELGLGIYDGLTMVPVIARPKSTGRVTLRSKNPLDPPIIRHNYLSSDRDMQVLLEGIALGRELYHNSAFDDIRLEEVRPGAHVTSEEDLRAYIRNSLATVWHHCGSCKMGRDVMSVVDPQLRVYGVTGLRVIDASVMPTITASNTHSTCIMIGEKGADLILGKQSA